VVIVSNAGLPKYLIDRLHMAIVDWSEFSYLIVRDPRQLQDNWLDAENRQDCPGEDANCVASQLLRAVSKNCYLLDVEDGDQACLAWLGSVCGHELRYLRLRQTVSLESSKSSMDEQVEQILSVGRELLRHILEERLGA
jgi:hypothetical protein